MRENNAYLSFYNAECGSKMARINANGIYPHTPHK